MIFSLFLLLIPMYLVGKLGYEEIFVHPKPIDDDDIEEIV